VKDEMSGYKPSIHSSKFEITATKSQLLTKKKIVIGMTGSVAVVEIVKLTRELMRHGAEVVIAMTKAALDLIQPALLEWASGNPVITKLTGEIEHVHLCGEHPDKADLLLIAPSTANTIGKIAAGIDDTVVTTFATTALGTGVPIAIVPAMHKTMYNNPIVIENIEKLKKIGVTFIGPRMEEGKAKIATTEEIIEGVITLLTPNDLAKKKVVVAAGPTRSWLDDVRFISNPSSGKTGIALALEAASRGADVVLLLGPTTERVPNQNITIKRFETPEELINIINELKTIDLYVSAAAIGDYQTIKKEGKIPSKQSSLNLQLAPTPKVIKHVKTKFPKTTIVGFKAEANVSRQTLISRAKKSLVENGLDFVVANFVAKEEKGFATDKNAVILITKDGKQHDIPLTSKRELAKKILTIIAPLLD